MISEQPLNIPISQTKQFYYNSHAGKFFLFNSKKNIISYIRSCRVEFAWHFTKRTTHIGFHYHLLDFEKLNHFFTKRENKLKLEKRTVFHKVENHPNLVIIELSPFWVENSTRRSLFTMLLRASIYYDNDFYAALNKYDLTKLPNIQNAIKYFFEGNVNPTYKNWTRRDDEGYSGFYAQYRNSDEEHLKKMLVKEVGQ